MLDTFFVPEVTKRVAERTKHKVEFVTGWGSTMVKVSDTLEGVQAGIIDVGAYCFCFEPSNLPAHAFQVMLPFGPMEPTRSLQQALHVYENVPFMREVFEKRFNQTLIALAADSGYNLITSFEWNSVADVKGHKISGAGLNLKWLEFAGAVPVKTTLPEVYTSIKTGLFEGLIMYPSAVKSYKFYEVAKYYTEIGFGTITWLGLTVNSARWAKLPKDVQAVMQEVALEYQKMSGTVNEERYPKYLDDLKSLMTVKKLPDSVRQDWARSLKDWPKEMAKELDGKKLPGTKVLNLALEGAEKAGHKWPIRYDVGK